MRKHRLPFDYQVVIKLFVEPHIQQRDLSTLSPGVSRDIFNSKSMTLAINSLTLEHDRRPVDEVDSFRLEWFLDRAKCRLGFDPARDVIIWADPSDGRTHVVNDGKDLLIACRTLHSQLPLHRIGNRIKFWAIEGPVMAETGSAAGEGWKNISNEVVEEEEWKYVAYS